MAIYIVGIGIDVNIFLFFRNSNSWILFLYMNYR
jgi:hypothetical protein